MKEFRKVLAVVQQESPVLYRIVALYFFLTIACIPLVFIDARTLMGESVWIKPLKFLISSGIYTLTVGFLMIVYPYTKKKKRRINGIVAWSLLLSTAIILFQGARGVHSHYNFTSSQDALLFSSMGIFTGVNVVIMILFIFDTIRLKLYTSKSVQWAILLGWCVVFFGSWAGGSMISQMSHTVGIAETGAGLPLVNWSTEIGDLRIAHFFGLHGIQIIPLFAVWVAKQRKINISAQIVAVTAFSLLYAGWIAFVFYQALQGMPLVAQN